MVQSTYHDCDILCVEFCWGVLLGLKTKKNLNQMNVMRTSQVCHLPERCFRLQQSLS